MTINRCNTTPKEWSPGTLNDWIRPTTTCVGTYLRGIIQDSQQDATDPHGATWLDALFEHVQVNTVSLLQSICSWGMDDLAKVCNYCSVLTSCHK